MEIRIDRGIPPPPEQPRYGELLRKLDVHVDGKSKSSFAIEDKEEWSKVRTAVSNAQRDTTMRFMTRQVSERDEKSRLMRKVLRVWRTA